MSLSTFPSSLISVLTNEAYLLIVTTMCHHKIPFKESVFKPIDPRDNTDKPLHSTRQKAACVRRVLAARKRERFQ